ncbi:MAG: DNA mismatch repair protein MutL, partial [Chloroflexi bacterium]|nr:DNA mismatch repair protein MutL [Chloroflexota bacterium]
MPIRVLPPDVAAKIAAGEVVERPVSVAKELLENAIDAGADDVQVEIVQGGRRMIRVIDNGCGIAASEVELALTRHATSKLRSAEDLQRIRTL